MEQLHALETYTDDGVLVREEITIPMLGKTVTRLVSKAEARADGARPELLVQTFVKPDRPIRNADRATTLTLNLRVSQGAMPPLPSAGAQRVVAGVDGTSAILTIDVNASQPATPADAASNLGASVMVDAEDPLIKALAAKAARHAGQSVAARAEAIRGAVRDYVTEVGLDTVFATASETAQTRSGDCSEHAVLLAAMLRAEGIPARLAIGLIYVDSFLGRRNIFGWHMWTQALIDGAWVDFDATLPVRYNAAHVLTSTSSLADGLGSSDMTPILMLLGNLDIDVLDVGYSNDDAR